MTAGFEIRVCIRKYGEVALKPVVKEEIETAIQSVFGHVELEGRANVQKEGNLKIRYP